jgi:hypothetical protein
MKIHHISQDGIKGMIDLNLTLNFTIAIIPN